VDAPKRFTGHGLTQNIPDGSRLLLPCNEPSCDIVQRVKRRKPKRAICIPLIRTLTETEARLLLRSLQGQEHLQDRDCVSTHNVDEITISFLMTISRADANRLRRRYNRVSQGWPTVSCLKKSLSNCSVFEPGRSVSEILPSTEMSDGQRPPHEPVPSSNPIWGPVLWESPFGASTE
jgi:hypothetical protein